MLLKRENRLLTLLTLLVSAFVLADAFDSSKLYKYDFQGAITSKVGDDDRPQYSGVSIKSSILVKKTGNNELSVKLDQPLLATFNEVINDIHTYNYNYTTIEQSAGLDKTFKIYFEDNQVKALDLYQDEPKWVSNFKRGLLSFFQLKLNSNENYYTTKEMSIFGDCDTDYIISSSPNVNNEKNYYMNVTKSRNMAKCNSRYLHRFMPLDSTECVDTDMDYQNYKHSNAVFNYKLKGNKQDFVIERVLLDEMSTFSPFGRKAHTHLVHTKFMMMLKQAEDGEIASVERGASKSDSISYSPNEKNDFYANINMENEHYLSNIYQAQATVEQVMNVLDKLVEEHKTYTNSLEAQASSDQANYQETSRMGELFITLNELVGMLNAQKLEQFYGQVDERGEAHKKIFWDLMSVVGTNPSFMLMKKLITDGDAPSVKIKDFLPRLSYHIKMPSKMLFDEYVNLCKSDKIQTNQQYKRLCTLPLASLIHQHCVKPHAKHIKASGEETSNKEIDNQAPSACSITSAEEYFSRFVSPQTSGEELTISDKMFNIKIAGEFGVKPAIDHLLDVIRNKDEHPSLRAAAMWNLAKASSVYPKKIKSSIVSYYYDQNELAELRIATVINWLKSGMTLHELETLGKQLMTEPNRQIVLYLHSYFKSIANVGKFPCASQKQKMAQLVLPTIKKALKYHSKPGSFLESRSHISSSWQADFGYGTASFVSAIYNNDSIAPSNIFYNSMEFMSGLKLSPMTVSIQAHGFDKVLKRVKGLFADKESFLDVFSLKKRSKREVAETLSETKKEYNDVYVAATISVYGRPVTFWDIDSPALKKMMSEDGTVKIPNIKKLLHSFNNHSSSHMMIKFDKLDVFNNELGLPIYQAVKDFDYNNFKLNSVKFDVEPGFFKDERQGKPPTKISAAIDLKMVRHNEILVSSGAILSNLKQKTGVGFYKKKLVTFPLKMSIEANLVDNKVSFKRQPIHKNILYIRQAPITFVTSYDPSLAIKRFSGDSKQRSNSWLALYEASNATLMKPFNVDYMTPLAIGVRLEGKHKASLDWSVQAWRKYLNEVSMSAAKFMYFYSPNGAPMEARLSTITTDENPTNELVTTFSWNHHHNTKADLNEVEKDLETYTDKEKEGKATTVSYQLSLVGGSSKERKVSADFSYSRSFDRLIHKWRALYQRTPLEQNSETPINYCLNGQMEFNDKSAVEKLFKFDLQNPVQSVDHSTNLTSELTFGDECAPNGKAKEGASKKISMDVLFDLSREQRQNIEKQASDSNGEQICRFVDLFQDFALVKTCKPNPAENRQKPSSKYIDIYL